ncbi:hypothetical protein AAMO2058_000768300 [Amorphochlora amoebiformis]
MKSMDFHRQIASRDSLEDRMDRRRVCGVAIEVLRSARKGQNVEKALKRALRAEMKVPVAMTKADRQGLADAVLGVTVHRKTLEYIATYPSKKEEQGEGDLEFDGLINATLAVYLHLHKKWAWEEIGQTGLLNQVRLPHNLSEKILWPRDPIQKLATYYSFPSWVVSKFVSQFGINQSAKLCRILNLRGPVTVRTNTLFLSREDMQETLKKANISTTPTRISPWGLILDQGRPKGGAIHLPAIRDGLMELQDEGSQLIALSTEWNESKGPVLDYCAGSGGKTLALATMAIKLHPNQSTPSILAWEPMESRRRHLTQRLTDLNLTDSIHILDSLDKVESKFGQMGCTLVDAPCSSSGTLRRHPQLRWNLNSEECEKLYPKLQREILANASFTVKPNGTLVYATCSIFREENEEVANWFDREFGDKFDPWPHSLQLQSNSAHHASCDSMTSTASHFTTLTPHDHGTDGFFIARWRRKAG